MSEQNIITVSIDINEFINEGNRMSALEKVVKQKVDNYDFVPKYIVPNLINTVITSAVKEKLSDAIQQEVEKKYGTQEAITKAVEFARSSIQSTVSTIMKDQTKILEKKIIEYMVSSEFDKIVASNVEQILTAKLQRALTNYYDD